jgi:hypothetical protein
MDTNDNPLPAIIGRGTAENPKNRFERLEVSLDPSEYDPEEPQPKTIFLKDTSRSIIAYNSSPDTGYNASINPYRGCEHGCVYCLAGDTPILMADGTTRSLEEVRPGDLVCGTLSEGRHRRYVRTRVLAHWRVVRPAYRVTLADGSLLMTEADHRFLTERGWKFVTGAGGRSERRPYLTPDDKLMGVGAFASSPGKAFGDGPFASYLCERQGRAHGDHHQYHPRYHQFGGLREHPRFPHTADTAILHAVHRRLLQARRDAAGAF